jgi:pimeloyl-ACP methyl ester carboxylesterase
VTAERTGRANPRVHVESGYTVGDATGRSTGVSGHVSVGGPADVSIGGSGGADGPVVVFLHGSGASAAVWRPVLERLAAGGARHRWLAVDLPGHGRSEHSGDYSPGGYADAVAGAVAARLGADAAARTPLVVVGHSLGGLIGLALADPARGLHVASVVVIAMKVVWTEEELARRAAVAGRAPRVFPDERSATELFGRVSGMREAPFTDADRATGVTGTADGYRLSADPGITAAPPATADEIRAIRRRVTCPIVPICGDSDPGIDPADMARVLGRPVDVLPGTGHNVHIERPEQIADRVRSAARRAGRGTAGGAPGGAATDR